MSLNKTKIKTKEKPSKWKIKTEEKPKAKKIPNARIVLSEIKNKQNEKLNILKIKKIIWNKWKIQEKSNSKKNQK